MTEIEHNGVVAMTDDDAPNDSQEDFFRGLAAHYMDALKQIIVNDDLNECHRLAGVFLGSNPPPADLVVGDWTDDDRARAWRDALDSMHHRAMRAEAVIRDNWCGDYWRAVNHRQADEVRATLGTTEGK